MHEQRAQVLQELRQAKLTGRALRERAMQRLSRLEGYSWSGVYRLEGDELVLDAYAGEPTDHSRIPVGQGVCGTAVAENRDQVVEDVTQRANYLSCSLKTRSEIVVLIRSGEAILGQIDVDSHRLGAFSEEDRVFLGEVAAELAKRWGNP